MVSTFTGRALRPGDADFVAEVSGFNLAIAHTPDLVIPVETTDEVVAAVRYARENRLKVFVQGTGHGAHIPVTAGVFVSTRRMNHVSIDPATRIATIGAGARWYQVVEAAAEHGLAAITGSSPNVGAVGYLLGGGLGPLARSHGFSSDYVESFTVVTGTGDVVEASANAKPDLFWALRGGKIGLGIVTEVRVRLVELSTIYGGSLWFTNEYIETAMRAWVDFTKTADPRVTTSVSVLEMPPFEFIPEPIRGRRLLNVRFAFPGDLGEGKQLAEPLRASAPIYIDDLGEMPTTQMGRIHNDPTEPSPMWVGGFLLKPIDQEFVTALLRDIETGSPFLGVEVRHIGAATKEDVPEGSAASGRYADYTLALIAANPEFFGTTCPSVADTLSEDLAAYMTPYTNMNFVADWRTQAEIARAWPPAIADRLNKVRREYDPDGVFRH